MKILKLSLLAFSVAILVSCKKEKEATEKPNDSVSEKKDSVVIPEIHKELYGIYTGDFFGKGKIFDSETQESYEGTDYKKLSLKINRITKDSVYGQSIVNGNQRPFRGVFNEAGNSFILDEPGDDKSDGRFEIKIYKDSMSGSWAAYKKTGVNIPVKNLKLAKKEFVYNPNFMLNEDSDLIDWENPRNFKEKYTDDDGKTESYTTSKNRFASDAVFKINASKQKLAEKDLKNLRKLDMEIIKNAVFARHGYAFKKPTYRYFFEQTDWYIPVSNNVDNQLSKMEKENVTLLNRFIKYAEDKYDQFGR
ncbi:serine/threonine protein kinase [Chryseobacterium sp. Leaf404]|uniref:YARHG domain-containing protein n=1 Tax=unclassified Chryseobacterium TaxID=2593645 RepID=UPI0006FF2BC8|nr:MULTISPECIES: YARHG domain-containing protein [unclassified Chryseobacterium]KQT22264.1 serine/threonine protein kinase [Chryseobacterium sp. Leaf404]